VKRGSSDGLAAAEESVRASRPAHGSRDALSAAVRSRDALSSVVGSSDALSAVVGSRDTLSTAVRSRNAIVSNSIDTSADRQTEHRGVTG
jgi:hypothetical protein